MEIKLKKVKIKDLVKGFVFDENENKGVNGLDDRLVIQPNYQRNYVYGDSKHKDLDKKLIKSLLNKYPIGVMYFQDVSDKDVIQDEYFNDKNGNGKKQENLTLHPRGKFQVLNGQQRITTIGRFCNRQIHFTNTEINKEGASLYYIENFSQKERDNFYNTELLVYICHGDDNEIKEWFKMVNTRGVPLEPQEILNAVYAGPFVEDAKHYFSRKISDSKSKSRSRYLMNDRWQRQGHLEEALKWISYAKISDKISKDHKIDHYMDIHKNDNDARELTDYFDDVISWIQQIFPDYDKSMKKVDWGMMYFLYGGPSKEDSIKKYKSNLYQSGQNSDLKINANEKAKELQADFYVERKVDIYQYVLSGCEDASLLKIRFFDDRTKKKVYSEQTENAKKQGISNCPSCVDDKTNEDRKTKIYTLDEMEADHVTPWSKGGETSVDNCKMLCKYHNRLKGNK